MLEEAILAVKAEPPCCRKENENLRKEGEDEQRRVFLEEELVASMLHKGQRESCSPIGAFEFSWSATHYSPDVGPSKRCVKEAQLPLDPAFFFWSDSASTLFYFYFLVRGSAST